MPSPSSPFPIVVLSGAGLSAASGVPTFRDADGLWEGHDILEVATPEGFDRNPALVRRFYDERRVGCAAVTPNAGHMALAELQQTWGPENVALITQNVDGLLDRAGCTDVIEMHGRLNWLRCEDDVEHTKVPITGAQNPYQLCEDCHADLRPDIVWFGEMPYQMERIYQLVAACKTFVAVGTSGVVYPAAGLAREAKARGATTIEVNPQPAGGAFDHVIAEGSETALPRLVKAWLARG